MKFVDDDDDDEAIILCSFTFTAKENRKIHLRLSNLQCCHFDIVILRVAVINNVQNVRLQRWHRPTDDASTRRWRGSQQTGPANYDTFITSLATFSLSNKYMPCFVVHIPPVSAVRKLFKLVKIWQSCSQMYTAIFYEPWQKFRFWIFPGKVRT